MEKNHRQGRPGAIAHALRRAHAQRLLVTLIGICRQLGHLQPADETQAACREVERDLIRLMVRREKRMFIRPARHLGP